MEAPFPWIANMVFRIKASLRAPRLREEAYKKAFSVAAESNIAQTAFTWVAVAVALIPVWSGASRATFEKLAADISFQIDNTPARRAPDRRSMGRNESDGELFLDRTAGVFGFRYQTSLEHLIFNEENNANQGGDPRVFARLLNPGPYNFVEQANDAARPVLEDFRPPSLEAFITVRRV